jgi:GAF domain-containing protein
MSVPGSGADAGDAAGAGASPDLPDQVRLRQLADTQAALRRVATLVGSGAEPTEVFTAVADELGRLVGAEATFVSRVDEASGDGGELGGSVTVVGCYGRVTDRVPVGFRLALLPGMIHTAALRTGRPARVSGERLAKGPHGAWVGTLGLRAGVASPIMVGGRRWGVMVATTSQPDFPPDTESRMTEFVELAAMAIANAKTAQELRRLADTQAALRRLATLVARGEPPDTVFAAANTEALRHFGGNISRMLRYEPDGTATVVASQGTPELPDRVGKPFEGNPREGVIAVVRRTGRAARVDDYRDVPGAEHFLRAGVRSSVATPIHVNGRLWGMIGVGTGEGPLPSGAEQRMSEFTDLIATAVANVQNRAALEAGLDELARLLAEQAALRRVATLVARGINPAEVFGAVSEEVRRLLGADSADITRFEADGASVVGLGKGAGDGPLTFPVGVRGTIREYLAPAVVWRTGRPAVVNEDAWSSRLGWWARTLRERGIRSWVASPITVEGRLWGVVNAFSTRGPFPDGTADRMADFTGLVATAIGNAESRAKLAASRARIVAAADETRRRIEQDLHDGTSSGLSRSASSSGRPRPWCRPGWAS